MLKGGWGMCDISCRGLIALQSRHKYVKNIKMVLLLEMHFVNYTAFVDA